MALLSKVIKRLKKTVIAVVISGRLHYYSFMTKRQAGSYIAPLSAMGKTNLTRKTHLGRNTNFNGLSIAGGGNVYIGDNFHSGIDCRIITQNHNYDYGECIPYDKSYIYKDVTIGDNVWIGDRVIILGGVMIGEGAIIQAGSVVVHDIGACEIAGGHPAKTFKKRDEAHYYSLKSQKKFL